MFKTISVLLAGAAVFGSGISSATTFDGPLQVKNQFAIFLPVNQPFLETAETGNSFSVSLSHSSVFIMEDSAQWAAHLDLELTELDFRFRRNIPGLFEVGVDLPVLRATNGFLDRPLAWYHRTFGFGDYGRHTRPYNSFLFDIRKNGLPVVEGENGRAGFGDVRITIKKTIAGLDPVLSVLADVELPTGDARIGYGSGSVDSGFALLLDKNIGAASRLYVNVGAVFPGDLKANQTVDLENFLYAGAGVESRVTSGLSLLGHLMVQTSPYPKTEIAQIDGVGMLLVLGGRFYGRSGNYELSLSEDPNTNGAPDFIINLSYRTAW